MNINSDSLIFFSSIVLFLLSWVLCSKSQYKPAIALLILAGFLIRLYTASDFYIHVWDERYHALVAKHLLLHPLKPTLYEVPALAYDYRDWGINHVWLHKQPLPLWSIAGSLYCFGNHELAVRLPSILLSTAGIWLTFYICRYWFNTRTAFIAAFLYAVNGLIIELSGGRIATDHPDIFFLFFTELAVFWTILLLQRKKIAYTVLAGISIGAAILCKWLPALIILPVWLLIVWDSRSFTVRQVLLQFLLLVLTTVVTFLPWQLYIHQQFPLEAAWESAYNIRHFFEVIEGQGGPWYYIAERWRIDYGELIYLPILWFIFRLARQRKNLRYWALLLWFLVPALFFSLAQTKMKGYILFTAPALFIVIAHFYTWLEQQEYQGFRRGIKYLVLVLLIALPLRYCIERVKPFSTEDRHPAWVQELKQLPERHNNKIVLFNYPPAIEAMFYTDFAAVYGYIPDTQVIRSLQQQGYTVWINDNGNLSPEVKMLPDIIFRKMRVPQP